jgi:hypothetical protein
MAINTEDRRRSTHGYTNHPIYPVADGGLNKADREHVAWLYRAIPAAAPGGVNVLVFDRAVFRRVFSRVPGRVN